MGKNSNNQNQGTGNKKDVGQEVSAAVAKLRKSFKSGKTLSVEWRKQQLRAFQRMMKEKKAEICEALWKDLHKNEFEAWLTEGNMVEAEIQYHLDNIDNWARPTCVPTDPLNIPGRSLLQRNPYGVVCVIGAWNYPVLLALQPLVGAISAGNCAVLKTPSDQYSAATSSTLARLVRQYLDPECIAVVEGDREATQAVLKERWDFIFFTGGCFVGRLVAEAAAKNLTPVALELGGKNPCVITESANIEVSCRRLVFAAFMNAGQTCVRPDHVLVHHSVADKFISTVKKTILDFYGSDPQKGEGLGRLINTRAFQRVAKLLEDDAKYIVHGGEVDEKEKYVAPTVLDFGTDEEAFLKAASMQDEIFGPLMPVFRYKDFDWVLNYINDHEKPLALSAFTSNKKEQERLSLETSSGSLCINDAVVFLSNHNLPFGGVGRSGMGAYHGKRTFEVFSHEKAVLVKGTWPDPPVRYPPFDPFKKQIVALATTAVPKWKVKMMKILFYLLIFLIIRAKMPSKEALKGKLIMFATQYLM